MSQIPRQVQQRTLLSAGVLALAPWLLALLFLFLAKLFLTAFVAMQDLLIFGFALIGFIAGFAASSDSGGARFVPGGIAALILGGLMYGLVQLCKTGLAATDRAIATVSSSFLSFALIGAIVGAAIGIAWGYYEYRTGRIVGYTPSRPQFVEQQPIQGLGHTSQVEGVDAFTREPLMASRGVYRCQRCSLQYHADTMSQLSGRRCSCGSETFARIA